MENRITSAEDFYKREDVSKVVTLPSGLTVRIRKINAHSCLGKGKPTFLQNARNLSKEPADPNATEAEKQERWINMSEEEKEAAVEMSNAMICDAVIEPVVSLERVEGRIFIADIPDADYNKLLEEIRLYSLPSRGKLLPFREEQAPDTSGQAVN